MKLLTNLIFEPKGKHDSGQPYTVKDTVMSADGSQVYFALQDVPAGIALSNMNYWKLQIDLSACKQAMDEAARQASQPRQYVGGEKVKTEGNPVSFLPDAGSLLKAVTVFEPVQGGNGDPSPENIRPFRRWTALRLTNAGKNLVNPPVPLSFSLQDFEYDRETGTIAIIKGEGGGANSQLRFDLDADASALVGKNVTLSYKDYSITTTGDSQRIYLSNQDGTTLATIWPAEESRKSVTAVIPEGTTGMRILIRIDQNNTLPAGTKLTIHGLQVEIGGSATEFVPFGGVKNHIVQTNEDVYGGKFDWIAGELLPEYEMVEFDGTENWRMDSTGAWVGERGNSFYTALPAAAVNDSLAMSNAYKGVYRSPESAFGEDCVCIAAGGSQIEFIRTAYRTVDTWKAYVAAMKAAGTPICAVYKRAVPGEAIQLTPNIITAVEAEQTNTLYGDANIEVEYIKPLHVSIEEHIAAAVAAAVHAG